MPEIKNLTDKDGNIIYPNTNSDAIEIVDNTEESLTRSSVKKTLTDSIYEIKNNISYQNANISINNNDQTSKINELYERINLLEARLSMLDGNSEAIYGNIIISKTNIVFNIEDTETFTIKLDKAPTSDQTIKLSCSNSNITIDKRSLVFTAENYSTPQIVTVFARNMGTYQIKVYSNNITANVNLTVKSSNGNTDVINNDTYIQLGNRIIGYRPVTNDLIDETAIIVNSVDDLNSAIANANPGDIIYARGNTYTFDSININKIGTASNPIIIKNYPGESAILNGKIYFETGCRYINFSGFKFQNLVLNNKESLITIKDGCQNLNIENLEITNISMDSVDSLGNIIKIIKNNNAINIKTESITIKNCYFSNCTVNDSIILLITYASLNSYLLKDIFIENMFFADEDSYFIKVLGDVCYFYFQNNLIKNSSCITLSEILELNNGYGPRDSYIQFNIFYKCLYTCKLTAVTTIHIKNNLLIDNEYDIYFYSKNYGDCNRSVHINHNTIICRNYGIYMSGVVANIDILDNILTGINDTSKLICKNYKLYYENSDPVVINNNCWFKPNGFTLSDDISGIFLDPKFINNTGSITGNYNLMKESPCIDMGITGESYQEDINNNSRANGISDLGAFESIY